MATQPELQAKLEEILGSRNVYFQPPESVKLKYPAIVYKRDDIFTLHANNKVYHNNRTRYTLTLIGRDPDSEIIAKILLGLPMCDYSRFYTADNLNHDQFTVYW